MKVSHIIYKVDDLSIAVESFPKKGFKVEYGSKKEPHNALIYFSEGPYIELLHKPPISSMAIWLLRFIGQGSVASRLKKWIKADEGYIDLCFENYDDHFNIEKTILKQNHHSFFTTTSQRTDPQGRKLRWKLLFPHEQRLPFLMTYFNIDPKPQHFTHPNGIKRIKRITMGCADNMVSVIHELCDDTILSLEIGPTSLEVEYGK